MATDVGRFALFLFPLLMIFAGVSDVMTMRIPNGLTAVLACLFFPFAIASGMPVVMLAQHVATGFGLLSVGYVLFSMGMFGGGDAKLMAAVGLWFGFAGTLNFLVLTALAGGALALAVGIMQLSKIETAVRRETFSRFLEPFRADVPYGFAFAAGAILAVPSSWWMSFSAAT